MKMNHGKYVRSMDMFLKQDLWFKNQGYCLELEELQWKPSPALSPYYR